MEGMGVGVVVDVVGVGDKDKPVMTLVSRSLPAIKQP